MATTPATAKEMKDAEDVRLAKTEAKLLINDEFDKTLVGVKGTICFHLIDSSVFGQFSVSLHHGLYSPHGTRAREAEIPIRGDQRYKGGQPPEDGRLAAWKVSRMI